MREFGWTYPSVYDPTGAIRDGLGLLGQPVTLFHDASGALVESWTGPLSEEVLGSTSRRSSDADHDEEHAETEARAGAVLWADRCELDRAVC